MGVTKRKDTGRWRARYAGPDGREHSRDFDRKGDAEKWLTTQQSAIIRGEWVDPILGKTTVGEFGPRWLTTKKTRKATTYATYDSVWRTHIKPKWKNVPLSKVSHIDVAEWIAGLEGSASTVRKVHQAFHSMLELAVRGKMLAYNPARGVDLPRVRSKEKKFLTAGQVDALADAAGGHYAPLVYFLAYTGCRWGEATALIVARLDLLRARAQVEETFTSLSGGRAYDTPKDHQRREVPLPRFLVDMLTTATAGKPAAALVFTTESGYPLQLSNFRQRVFDPACEKAKVGELTPHDLRHTAASLAIASGASVKAVQSMLGHKTATMTLDLYGHLYPDEMDALASALDKVAEEARSKTADVRQLKAKKGQV